MATYRPTAGSRRRAPPVVVLSLLLGASLSGQLARTADAECAYAAYGAACTTAACQREVEARKQAYAKCLANERPRPTVRTAPSFYDSGPSGQQDDQGRRQMETNQAIIGTMNSAIGLIGRSLAPSAPESNVLDELAPVAPPMPTAAEIERQREDALNRLSARAPLTASETNPWGEGEGEAACTPPPPNCDRAGRLVTQALADVPRMIGIRDSAIANYCALLIGQQANIICEKEYRTQNKKSCADAIKIQIRENSQAISTTKKIIDSTSSKTAQLNCHL